MFDDQQIAAAIKSIGEDALKSPKIWLQHLASGRTIDLANPSVEDIRLSDICRGLSRIRRWSGQAGIAGTGADFDFSVGQHVLSSDDSVDAVIASDPDIPKGESFRLRISRHLTVHDMPETYTGDIIAPLKFLLGDVFKAIESNFETKIATAIDVPVETDEVVLVWAKEIDVAASWAEMSVCFPATAEQSRVRYTQRQIAIAEVMTPFIVRRAAQDQETVRRELALLASRHGARESIHHKEILA